MNFLKYVEQFCLENKIELMISAKDRVNCYSMKCNGFFDNAMPINMTKEVVVDGKVYKPTKSKKNKMVLAYSTGEKTKEEILSLVAHEFGHANQFLEGSDLWVNTEEFQSWENYFDGESNSLHDVTPVWKKIVKLEADCEKRVIGFIDDFSLDINKKEYAQKANSYLFFYNFALKNKEWYHKAPYEIEGIVKKMPDEIFDLDFYAELENPEIIKTQSIFNECFT